MGANIIIQIIVVIIVLNIVINLIHKQRRNSRIIESLKLETKSGDRTRIEKVIFIDPTSYTYNKGRCYFLSIIEEERIRCSETTHISNSPLNFNIPHVIVWYELKNKNNVGWAVEKKVIAYT